MVLDEKYDVIVVGGGHAGCEASYCAAKMGANVLLVTMNMQTIGQMTFSHPTHCWITAHLPYCLHIHCH